MSRGSDTPSAQTRSGKALASLILGLLSFCIPIVPGFIGLILGLLGLKDVRASGGQITGSGMALGGIVASLVGSLVSCLGCGFGGYRAYDAFNSARERVIITNNLRQIGIAVHSYDRNMWLPRNIKSPNGQALLSWRVAILPHLEQDSLYRQFDLTQPWDSRVTSRCWTDAAGLRGAPTQFVPGRTNTTPYRGFAGPGASSRIFRLVESPSASMNVLDGTSNTILSSKQASRCPGPSRTIFPLGQTPSEAGRLQAWRVLRRSPMVRSTTSRTQPGKRTSRR